MGRGNNSSLLYGNNLGALKSDSGAAFIAGQEVPDYHSLETRKQKYQIEYYPLPIGNQIKEEIFGDPFLDQAYLKRYYNTKGILISEHKQAPTLGYDYVNGRYYESDDEAQPEYETQVPEPHFAPSDLEKIDPELFAHQADE